MDYPYFFKQKKMRLKLQGRQTAGSERKQRTLSITPNSI
jgi:hypothetical protein